MPTPDESAIVFQTAEQYPDLLRQNTQQSILQFMQILGPRLAATNQQWGYLTKTPAEKHLTLPNGQYISVDSFIFQSTQQVVDCLTNAVETSGPAGPAWQHKEKRENNHWYPIGPPTTEPPPTNGGNGDCNCEEEIRSLQEQINDLNAKLAELSNKTIDGKHIALQSVTNNKYLRVRFDQPDLFVEATAEVNQWYEEFIIKQL